VSATRRPTSFAVAVFVFSTHKQINDDDDDDAEANE